MAKFLNIDKLADEALGLNRIGIGQVRSVEWGKKYLWDVKFQNPDQNIQPGTELPKSFQDFFPASDVEENLANLETFQFEVHQDSFKVPRKSSVKDLKLTFFDDNKNSLLNWFDDWINRIILNNGEFLTPVADCLRLVQVRKLNNKREQISENSYWVFPEGPLIYNGSSSSDPQTYSMPLVIVGIASKGVPGQTDTFNTLVRSFGRQIVSGGIGNVLRGL